MNIISDFVSFCPLGIKNIEEAIIDKNGEALEVAASSFYGVVGHFHADNLIEKAIVLEIMGRYKDFNNAQKALGEFKEELDLLIKGLQNMNLSDLVA